MGAGVRFTVFTYRETRLQSFSFEEVDLKDDSDLVTSGFPVVCCDEGIVSEDFPTVPGLCRVGGALFMVGGMLNTTKPCSKKWLWSAPPPPLPGGSSTMTWTRCDAAMDSGRLFPMVVPLHDGRVFICGGTSEPKSWVEIYDPEKGEFDRRDLPDQTLNPFPSSCFRWADHSVMLYFTRINIKEQVSKPSLVLYDVERNNWEIFAENLPDSELFHLDKRKLIYVGGNILFMIDQASCWFVYDLSAKKVVAKMDVRVEDGEGEVMQAFYLGNNDIQNTSWIFYIFLPEVIHRYGYTDLRYAKVEVVQGKGGDYAATVQLSGLLRVGYHTDLYIIADDASRKGAAKEELLKEKEEDEK
ncbi:uncharacterized protein LOC125204082 [Salvia hispanica]|uniref:uncharacterized protein LOC125204082 n=1 Tax=Salvia hispanica TaxID=49212 RepID=UPI00200923EE|nr:uncharacterized protein LOC125204082 [Salvia hispanica]XP_047958587.1 uncharacterized protein LOC125204082 [Salvia hispanica]